jgi:hypothetical protein
VPNHLISQEDCPERLLRLVADKLDNFNVVNVATAFSRLGRHCGSGSFPRNIAVDDRFRGLMGSARGLCADGRLQARELANIFHAVAKMGAAGKLAASDAGVQDMLEALEQRAVLVASDMEPQEVSNTIWSYAKLGLTPGAQALAALEVAVLRVGSGMKPQETANTVWAFGTLGMMPGEESRAALEAAVVRVGPSMNPQDTANIAWSFATLGLTPRAEAQVALEAAVVRVGPSMNAQATANTAWSFATLGLTPGAKARAALEAAVLRVGPSMNPQATANTAWGFGTLGLMPGGKARAALEAAVVRVGPGMNAQETANTAWSFATLGLMPRAETWAALEAGMVRVGPGMSPQAVANAALSFATLGLTPGAEARAALEAAVVRVGPGMNVQHVANTLWSFTTLAATRSVPLPACYPALWLAACGLDVGSLKDVDLLMMYHAHLIHTELVGRDMRVDVTFPPWIMHEARETWMRGVRDDVTVSAAHKEIASIIGVLGVPYQVESLSDGGCFSVDVFLTDHDVAIEIDGPTHFINASDGGEGAAPGDTASRTTRTPKTQLRDKFLGRRYRTVLSVPHFEWEQARGSAEKKQYVAAKLKSAGVSVPAPT